MFAVAEMCFTLLPYIYTTPGVIHTHLPPPPHQVLRVEDAHDTKVLSLSLFEGSAHSDAPLAARHLFLSSALDGYLHLWDLRAAAGGPVRTFAAHTNRVHPLQPALSPCLRYVACGSEDRQGYLYDVGTARLLERVSGHSDAVTAVAFNPFYPQLATTGLDGTARFYSDRGDQDG
eukprot:scaffold65440_cov30-Tisochrysis_lutea.AAC.1